MFAKDARDTVVTAMRRFGTVLPCLLLAAACGPNDPESGDGGGDATEGNEATAANDSADTDLPGGTAAADDESTGEPPPPFEAYPARGIRITEVYADHGVSVPIVLDGEWVDGNGRNAELVSDRTTMIRGFWELDPDFEPRTIEGRLTITLGDGSTETASRFAEVSGPSHPNDLDTNMYFILPGEFIDTSTQFQLELFETQEGYRDLPEPEQYQYPPEPGFIGVEGSDMALEVVIVPIDHDIGAQCPEPPEITDDELQYLSDQLFMQNPVRRVEMTRRAPVPYTSGLSGFGGLLNFMADLRAQDGADPAAYYYGVVIPCDGGPEGVGGQAISIPDFPTQGNAWTRTSVGRWYGSLSSTAGTFVHEVGHTQGRRHVACNGDEGGVNPSYPYDAGDIGVWGFGAIDFSLHGPNSAKDYMTYCGNTWVSDWGWSRVVPFIREITSWGGAGPVGEDGRVLVGLIEPHVGQETWFTTPGTAEGLVVDGRERLTFQDVEGRVRSYDAAITPMGDEDGYAVVIELPSDLSLADQRTLSREHEGIELSVPQIRDAGQVIDLTL